MISIIEPDNTDENSDWIKIVIYKRLEKDKKVLSEKDIEKSVKIAILDVVAKWWEGRKFKHPETEHMVLFKSLPVDEQKRLNDMVKEKKKEKTKEKPKEEDLSKMLKDVAEGVQERKADTMNAIAKRLSQDELQKLLKMKPSWLGTIKAVIVQRVDQIGLKMMMKDELYLTRETVASRIDLKELPNMMNDEDSAVRYAVSKRIDYKNLLKMIKNEKRNSGLKERMEERRMRMEFIGLNTIEEFKKTGNFNMDTMSNYLKQTIKNIDGDSIKTEECSKCIDELYAQTKYNLINEETRHEWLQSSNNEGAAVLKGAIKALYGGEIRHHDDVSKGRWDDYLKNSMWRWDSNEVFDYVKIQKAITEKLLDLKYPGQEEFNLYRGTKSSEEEKDTGKNCKILTNSLSSWALEEKVAERFGDIVLKTKFRKDEVFSCFLTHSHTGNEAEFITIGKEDKIGTLK